MLESRGVVGGRSHRTETSGALAGKGTRCSLEGRPACFWKSSPGQPRKEDVDGPGHRHCACMYPTHVHTIYSTILTSITPLTLDIKLHTQTQYIVRTIHTKYHKCHSITHKHNANTFCIIYTTHTTTDILHTHTQNMES